MRWLFPGAEIRIDLPGGDCVIRDISSRYGNNRGGDHAQMKAFGKVSCGAAGGRLLASSTRLRVGTFL